MSNLLPLAAQKRVTRMYRARVVTALALATTGLACVLLLALIPAFLTVSAAGPRDDAATVKRNVEATQAIMRAQRIVEQLLPVLSSGQGPSSYLESALAVMPSGVTVHHVVYGETGGAGSLMLIGEASRDKVAAFRDALSAHPLFVSASVPVSALVGTGSGQFSLSLELASSTAQ
jgi:hypothetical protein